MEIKGISFSDQMRMMRGAEGLTPKSISIPEIGKPEESKKASFAEFLGQQIQETNNLGLEADRRMQSTLAGNEENPHETVLAMQKAEISFKLMMSVRDKLEQAYQQIVRASIG